MTRKLPEKGLARIIESFDADVWMEEAPPSAEQIIDRARYAEGLVTLLSDPINADLIESLPRLRVIAQYAVGYDNIDVRAATERGIMVTNTPGVLTETTADLTWALILAASRRITEADQYVRRGKWRVAWGPELLLGEDVHGATLGVVGLGRIGQAVARRAKGFDMRVIYHTRSQSPETQRFADEQGAVPSSFDNLLREADIVTLHVPLTADTHHMIGEGELRLMKSNAILVNTSRGAIIDQKALLRVLESGHLFSVGLDVFEEEPTPSDNPLLSCPRVIAAPHIGSATRQTRTVMAEMCAKNLIAALTGERPPNIVNPEVL